MQFIVIGAGNLGCVYGGNLARIGESVAFIDTSVVQIEAIHAHGLHLEGLTGDFTVHPYATTDSTDLPDADVVLICVNSYATNAAAQTAKTVLKENGFCLTLQNGVGNVEILTEILGVENVLAALSFQSGDIVEPGHVRHTNDGHTFIGELNRQKTERLASIVDLFQKGGLNPVVVDDITATIWAKFVHNCGINAICAITDLRPGQIREVAELDSFQTAVIEETVALVTAKGITLPDADPVGAIRKYCAHKFHRPSMQQHLDRDQRTEIDALNGYVARESPKYGLSAPYSDALTKLIKGREHKGQHWE